jgi:UDP-2-acetamido-3-amino-2,3-dideoxy-glucuronate N-acetyltransferase
MPDAPLIHERALCESDDIGSGTRIWAFAHVLAGARIGEDCNICDGVFIEGDVVVGDRVTVKCGVQLWNGVILEDDVFIGPNATFTNDRFPRSRQWVEHARTIVAAKASIGANATILPGIEIGRGAMVGAGAVVTRPVPPYAVVTGNPARIQGYVQTESPAVPTEAASASTAPGRTVLPVRGTHVQRFSVASDLRGRLTAGEMPSDGVPFEPKRWFLVYDVPSREVRGEHAHRSCHQFLVCVSGHVTVAVDDGEHRAEVLLNHPALGIYIPPLVWASQFRYDADAVLLVLASHPYDASDYIREYDSFLAEVGAVSASE